MRIDRAATSFLECCEGQEPPLNAATWRSASRTLTRGCPVWRQQLPSAEALRAVGAFPQHDARAGRRGAGALEKNGRGGELLRREEISENDLFWVFFFPENLGPRDSARHSPRRGGLRGSLELAPFFLAPAASSARKPGNRATGQPGSGHRATGQQTPGHSGVAISGLGLDTRTTHRKEV